MFYNVRICIYANTHKWGFNLHKSFSVTQISRRSYLTWLPFCSGHWKVHTTLTAVCLFKREILIKWSNKIIIQNSLKSLYLPQNFTELPWIPFFTYNQDLFITAVAGCWSCSCPCCCLLVSHVQGREGNAFTHYLRDSYCKFIVVHSTSSRSTHFHHNPHPDPRCRNGTEEKTQPGAASVCIYHRSMRESMELTLLQ